MSPSEPLTDSITISNNKYVSPSAPVRVGETPNEGGISQAGGSYQTETEISAATNLDTLLYRVDKPVTLSAVSPPTLQSGQETALTVSPPTLQSGQETAPKKRMLNAKNRRFYSRSMLGLKLPGNYYFGTWTSSPQSPPIEKSWRALRKWLKRKRPGSAWIYCITKEGFGVIHMIIRIGKGEKRLDAKEVRKHWEELHKANQVWLEHVDISKSDDLAGYLSDQRKKKGLAGEMAYQDLTVRWRWSNGWLPKGFTMAFRKAWWNLKDISPGQREKAITDWLLGCHLNNDRIFALPKVTPEKEVEYPKTPVIIPKPQSAYIFDKNLKKAALALADALKDPVDIPEDSDDLAPEGEITRLKWEMKYKGRTIQEKMRKDLDDYNMDAARHVLDDEDRRLKKVTT